MKHEKKEEKKEKKVETKATKKEKTGYLQPLKKLWSKNTLLFMIIDLGIVFFAAISLIVAILIFKQGYFSFVKTAPVFGELMRIAQASASGAAGMEPTLLGGELSLVKGETFKFLGYTIAAFLAFTILFGAGAGAGNAYIWSRIRKTKMTIKLWLNNFYMTMIMIIFWIIIYFLTIYLIRSAYIVFLIVAYIFLVFLSFQVAYSYTEEKFWKSLKDAFTKPFKKIHIYAAIMILTTIAYAITSNLLFAISYFPFPKNIGQALSPLAMITAYLLYITTNRYYDQHVIDNTTQK